MKFQIIFLSLLVGTLQAANQANNSLRFKIAGYPDTVTIDNYLNYQRFADMFEDIGPDETSGDIVTFQFPPFITPEVMRNLEDIVRCNNAEDLNDQIDRIYRRPTSAITLAQPKTAVELLTILLAAQFMEIQNPLFNFATITQDNQQLAAIQNLPLNFLRLVIARFMNLFGKTIIQKQFMDEYQA